MKAKNHAGPERWRILVLARLLPRNKEGHPRRKVIADLALCSGYASAEGQERVAREVEACVSARLASEGPARGCVSITAEGETLLRTLLGIDVLPRPRDWLGVQARLLAPLSLALPFPGEKVRVPGAEELAAAILVRWHQLPDGKSNLAKVADRLAWRALGVETGEPFSVDRVQRHLLRDIVAKDARVERKTWRLMLAVPAVGARSPDGAGLRQAAIASWLQPLSARASQAAAEVEAVPQPSLAELARAVIRAAAAPGVARFHDDRAYIGSVWEHMRGHPPLGDMSLADFKQQLVAAHRAGHLRITRADLVGAMDSDEVQRSEASYMGATFHFVALDAGAAP